MQVKKIHLKEHYPFLDNNGADPTLTAYLQNTIVLKKCEDGSQCSSPPRPALVVCPGGGYANCSPREGEVIAVEFMSCGMNAFVLDYSAAPHTFPQSLLEMAAAVDMIVKNAKEWNIDIDKIAAIGFSAGGHLAASYCTLADMPEVQRFIDPRPLNSLILGYPVILAGEYAHRGSIKNLSGNHEYGEAEIEKFSLDKHICDRTPPTFLWHTAGDTTVPPMNSLAFAAALSKNEIPFELHIYPQGKHGMSLCNRQVTLEYDDPVRKYNGRWVEEAKRWLKSRFAI